MAFTQPKFEVGQVVFAAQAEDEAVQAVCPDCSGSKTWTASSPAGDSFSFPCPRCQNHDVWKLRHNKAVATIRKLTIGSVRIDSADDSPVSYMCVETGVGSGTIWPERRLAADEHGAKILGEDAVAERELWRATELERRERNSGWGPAGMSDRLEVALRYQSWTTAEISRAKSEKWAIGYQYERLCNTIAELDEYGAIDGLTSELVDRIVSEIAHEAPQVKEAREAVLHDRKVKAA